MHSQIYGVMSNDVAAERARRSMVRAVHAPRPERPPSAQLRARAAFAVGRPTTCQLFWAGVPRDYLIPIPRIEPTV